MMFMGLLCLGGDPMETNTEMLHVVTDTVTLAFDQDRYDTNDETTKANNCRHSYGNNCSLY